MSLYQLAIVSKPQLKGLMSVREVLHKLVNDDTLQDHRGINVLGIDLPVLLTYPSTLRDRGFSGPMGSRYHQQARA